jgi:CubicO group peptidase (beta-lactamase class C family)
MDAMRSLRQHSARAVISCAAAIFLAAPALVTPALLAQTTADGTVRPSPTSPLRDFDAYVARGMKEWKVPGVAVGVVHGDSIVLLEGYGVRTMGKPERVDPHTLFAIASDTKAFTGMLMAMLADSGRVHWDDHVSTYLPELQLYDPYVTHELAIRDLLTHRSGLARADLLWTAGYGYSTAETLRRVRYLKPSWSFRTHYGYNNLMYGAAGEVIARASGMSWADMLRARIFRPLGMTCSNTSVTMLPQASDVATPHAIVDSVLRTEPYTNIDMIPAAGAINSCVADMVQWLRFQLDSGRVNGTRLVSPRNFRETHTPQLAIRIDSAYRALNPATHMRSYAIGWSVYDYHGREMLTHPGDLSGMSSMVGLLPEERLGVVVLSNMEGQALRESLMYWIFDRYLGAPMKDWSAETLAEQRRNDAADAKREREVEAKRVKGTKPPLALDAYAGTYADSLYGPATVRVENGHLVLELTPKTVGDMEHWQYDTFRVTWRDHRDGKSFVQFDLDPVTAKVTRMRQIPDPGEPVEQVPVWVRMN